MYLLSFDCQQLDGTIFGRCFDSRCGNFKLVKNLLFGSAGVILENKDVLEPGVGVIVKISSGVPHSVDV